MADPDPLRIKYREQLINGVQSIVRGGKAVSADITRQLVDDLVPENDRKAFHKMIMDALCNLHEGNVARYQVKLSEFQKWKKNLN